MMSFASRLRTFQRLCRAALVSVATGLLAVLFAPTSIASLVHWTLGIGFLVAIISSLFLAMLACPRCHRNFCGSLFDQEEAPMTTIFTKQCHACGHQPQ